MVRHHEVSQNSEEWLQLREGLYTGSNADKLLAGDGAIKIVDGSISGYASAESSGFGGNFHTKRGHILEEQAIEIYEAVTGRVGLKAGFVTNSKYPRCGYSPDDIHPDRTVEVKCFIVEKHLKMYEGDIPRKVLAQCHFGMLICGVKLCNL